MPHTNMKLHMVLVACVGALVLMSLFSYATPQGPNSVTRGASQRKTLIATGPSQQAEAGNLTSLVVSGESVTKRWQGFFGNITGGIKLDDANNNSLYSWGDTDPDGEIYAANGSSVDWDKIQCVNFSTNTSVLMYNVTQLNAFIGLTSPTDQASDDSVNATFNLTYGDNGDTFSIGSIEITNADNCSMVRLFNSSGDPSENFQEVLLTDNESIVFATIISQNQRGYDNTTVDFQMIVGVNGTVQGTVRNYFFYVELL